MFFFVECIIVKSKDRGNCNRSAPEFALIVNDAAAVIPEGCNVERSERVLHTAIGSIEKLNQF